MVMHLLVAIKMDRPGEIGIGLELIYSLGQQQRVGADDGEFPARDHALDDLREVLVQKRFAASDDHDRRAAFVHRSERIFNRQALVENMIGVVDFAATGACQIAAEQRLHHEHERITLAAENLLPQEIGADCGDVTKWNGQGSILVV